MTEKELKKLFEEKLEGLDFEFNEANWEAFEQMSDPQEPLSEQEYKKLFRDKLAAASFPFNPDNWEALESELGPEHGMTDQELSDLFRKKMDASQFSYNPDNWTRMEAILDQRARKPLAFFWRSAAAIFIAAGLSLLFLWQNESPLSPAYEEVIASQPEPSNEPASINKVQPSGEAETTSNIAEPSASTPESALPETSIANHTASSPANSSPNTYVQNGRALISGARPLSSSPEVAMLQTPQKTDWTPLETLPPQNTLVAMVEEASFVPYTPIEDLYVPKRYSTIYAVGGTGISQSMNGRMGNPGWQLGLEYEYGWSDKASLRTGLVYAQSGDIGLETLHDSTFFGLGRTEVQTHRHYKSLKTLQIPIAYQYQLASKHRIGLGLQANILLSVVMDQTKTTTVFKQDPKVEHRHFDQQMNSFNPVNLAANLSYEYQYSERLSLRFSYIMALNDITNDQAQNFEADHRPSQANLQLRYRLFEK
jgi:hypothetical protein